MPTLTGLLIQDLILTFHATAGPKAARGALR